MDTMDHNGQLIPSCMHKVVALAIQFHKPMREARSARFSRSARLRDDIQSRHDQSFVILRQGQLLQQGLQPLKAKDAATRSCGQRNKGMVDPNVLFG